MSCQPRLRQGRARMADCPRIATSERTKGGARMVSTGSDDRIPRFIEAAEALRDGRFGVRVPEAGSGDQVARLGAALNDLSSALERRWREVAEVDAIAARINAGLLLDDVLEDFYREAREIFPYDRIGFSLLESGGTVVRARWAASTERGLTRRRDRR